MQRLLGCAEQHKFHSFQRRQHDRDPGRDGYIHYYRDAGEFVHWDRCAYVLGYELAHRRNKPHNLQPFPGFGHHQQHDGPDLRIERDHDFLNDSRSIPDNSYGHLWQCFADYQSVCRSVVVLG